LELFVSALDQLSSLVSTDRFSLVTDDPWALGLQRTFAERLAQLNVSFTNVIVIPAVRVLDIA
jgi:hypothetical protein